MEQLPSTLQAMKDYVRYAKAQIARNNKQNEKLNKDIISLKAKIDIITHNQEVLK